VLTRLLNACWCATVLTVTVGAQSPTDVSARRVPFHLPVVGLPLTPYSLQRAMADVAWALVIPIGYEAPAEELWQPAPPESTLKTEGRTIEQILNEIVARQPRYLWTIDDGVVHLRPKTAVADSANVLNHVIEEFVVDRATLREALREVHFTLRPELRGGGIVGSGPGPSALGLRRFSVSLASTTVQGVLDAIVKVHGASSWSVTYVADAGAARPYRISFHTFDGWSTTW